MQGFLGALGVLAVQILPIRAESLQARFSGLSDGEGALGWR